jgi:hypothetical protein
MTHAGSPTIKGMRSDGHLAGYVDPRATRKSARAARLQEQPVVDPRARRMGPMRVGQVLLAGIAGGSAEMPATSTGQGA